MIFLIIKLMSYLKGYVKIYARGYFLERFLNLCLIEDILLWELSRPSEHELYAKVSINAFKNMKSAARKTRTRVNIVQKNGFPFFIHRNRKRRGILAGILIFALIIGYFSTHLMGITINGGAFISDEALTNSLNSYGVKIGTPLNKINTKILKNQLMTANEELGWIGINLKGSRLFIEIKERKGRVDAISSAPCNLVAAKDGVVRLMEVRDGQTMVLKDTPVKAGDLLVSGVIDSNTVGMRYTYSHGEVFAETYYKEEIEIPLKYTQKRMTGNIQTKCNLQLLGLTLKLYLKDDPDYKNYQSIVQKCEFSPPLKIFPSLFIEKKKFFEQKEHTKTRTVNEAAELGKFQLLHRITAKLSKNGKIQSTKLSFTENNQSVTVFLECICYENIAVQVPIDKTEDLEYNVSNQETQMR